MLTDGSYSIGPRQLSESNAAARFEHCLAGDDPESRVKRLGEEAAWKLLSTEVRAGPRPQHAWGAARSVRCSLPAQASSLLSASTAAALFQCVETGYRKPDPVYPMLTVDS